MGINEIIMYIMMFFMLIAAVDRILSQFGGSARFLGKFGKSIEGSGGQFEEGFMAMGALGLAMVGMTALAPVLAHVLGPVIIPVYEMLGANPSMFAGTLLACDMGGFFLAKELAGGDVAAWLYSGLILGSMMGPTIVFSIPVALGIIEPSDRRYLALGVLAGIVTIPIGCIAGGLVAMYSGVQINGQPVEFTFALILMNMIPVIIVAILVALGLKFIPEKMINGFQIFAKFLVALITLGLAAAVVKFLLGWELIPGLDPIFMAPGDKPGEVMRAIEVIGSISCVLLGAYPMVLLLTRWFEKPLMSVGKVLNMNNIAANQTLQEGVEHILAGIVLLLVVFHLFLFTSRDEVFHVGIGEVEFRIKILHTLVVGFEFGTVLVHIVKRELVNHALGKHVAVIFAVFSGVDWHKHIGHDATSAIHGALFHQRGVFE